MKTLSRSAVWVASVMLAAVCLCYVGDVRAQAVMPTPEQLEMLRSLPPDQQQALIDKAQESVTGAAPLVGVGQAVKPPATEQSGVRPGDARAFRDADGDGLEDSAEPPKSIGELKPFGYDIFRRQNSDFEPEAAIPVPSDYVLGPGDRLEVQLYGNERGNYMLIVGRDGQVRFPKLGPVSVGGMRFEDVKELVSTRVTRQFVGTDVSISMGELRSIRVFVLGDVARPGSYLVSALSTISNALLNAGGIAPVGSLRDVQLKRAGSVVSRLDLYDLLLNGDSSRDARLQAGDVIFVPPVGTTVSVFGEINRPAIYEVKSGATVGELVFLSGGLKPKADPKYTRLERISGNKDHITVDLDLSNLKDRQRKLANGDVLVVTAIRAKLQSSIELIGAVQRPRAFEFTPGMYLTDILSSVEELNDNSDPEYVVVRRDLGIGRAEVISRDLLRALKARRSAADLELMARDRIIVLRLDGSRAEELKGVISELQQQGRLGDPSPVVSIGGVVRAPGQYPLESGMRVSDLLRAGASAAVSAYPQAADLTRYEVVDGERREIEVIRVDFAAILRGDPIADMALRPFDVLTVKQVPEWTDTEMVTISGEVRFPGSYPIRKGETLLSVLERAGGILPRAFVEGTVFTRAVLRDREREELNRLTSRLRSDLAVLALQSSNSSEKSAGTDLALTLGRGLLADLQSAQPMGRLVVDGRSLGTGLGLEIELRGGDSLVIPRPPQSVMVIGEVQSSTSHLWRPGTSRDDYIKLSGGLTAKADSSRVYVVRADGSVIASKRGGGSALEIRPGDTIVAPLDAERIRPLPLWTSITTIIYNLAIAAAAVNSF